MSQTSAGDDRAARVVESFGRRVIVETAEGERLAAEMFGKRLVCVCGDDVDIRISTHAGDVARVTQVRTRRTLFARTDSRGKTEPLAANLTLLAVIVAPEPAPDPYIADRYLAGAAFAGITSLVIVNKADLPTAHSESFQGVIADYRRAGIRTVVLCAREPGSIESLRTDLHGQVTMLVGQSGVGKSTLTNQLAPASARATRALSGATGEGRHTTVSTALFRLSAGGELIDSPGVRDYAPPLIEDASVQVGWPELRALSTACRFNNCLHLREPGCAVTHAVAAGELSARRYESYKRLLNIMRGLAPDYARRR